MAAPTKRRLYSQAAATTVRDALTGVDAGTWIPEDEGASADDNILDAREWDTVRVFAEYTGTPSGETVTVTPLIAMPRADGVRQWRELSPVSGLDENAQAEVEVHGHDVSFRATTVTLGGAASVAVRVTGGARAVPDAV